MSTRSAAALVHGGLGSRLAGRRWASLLAVLSVLSVVAVALAQPALALAQQGAVPGYRPELAFDHALKTDGMSFNGSFFQDRDGFFWIATQSGLFRWDGYGVSRLDASPESVYSAFEDREGLIWIISTDRLSVYDKSTGSTITFKHDPHDPTSIVDAVFNGSLQPISEDPAGDIWFGTQAGLSEYDRKTKTFATYVHDPANQSSLVDDDVVAVWVDEDDKVWVGTRGGLDELDPETGVFHHHMCDPNDPTTLSSNAVTVLFEDQSGALWAGTEDNGLNRIERKTGVVTRYLHDSNNPRSLASGDVFSITEPRPGELWITSTAGGLDVLDERTGIVYHYQADPKDPNSLSTNNPVNVYRDPTGTIWVVHFDGILDKIDPNGRKFALYQNNPQDSNSLATNAVSSVYEDKQGVIWFALLGNGIDRYDRATSAYTHYPNAPGGTCTFMYEDGDGVVWVTGAAGIFSFQKESGAFSPLYPLDGQWATAIVPDPSDSNILWVGTDTAGLVKFNKTTKSAVYFRHDPADPRSLSNNSMWDLLVDKAGFIWVPTGNGLNKFEPAGGVVVAHYANDPNNPSSLGADSVNNVYQDSAGRIWVGTNGGGLERLNTDGTFTRFDRASGFPTDVVTSIIQDNQGLLWLGTEIGLIKFDPNSGASRVYTKADGLQGNQFWELPVCKTPDGEIWECGGNGANSFYPDRLKDNPNRPPVCFTALTQGGEPLKGLEAAPERVREIKLDWRNNFFEFEVAALDFTSPDKNQYQYILEGFDKSWYNAGTKHSGRYSGLSAGTYTLRVRGSNNDGVWSDKEAVLKVVVVGPFWQATWFIVLLVLVAAVLAGGVALGRMYAARGRRRELERLVAERTAQLLEANDELEAFAYSVSHDLRTPLRAISGFSEILARRHRAGLNDEGRHYLDNVVQAGERMQLLIDDLLDYSRLGRSRVRLKPVALRDILALIAAELGPRAQELGATIEIAEDLPIVLGDETLLGGIFTNLLDNALTYRRLDVPPRVSVTCCLEGDAAVLAVADNGIGIPPESLGKVFDVFHRLHSQEEYPGTGIGLAAVKKSAQMMKGSVRVESEVGKGATFFVRLPRSAP